MGELHPSPGPALPACKIFFVWNGPGMQNISLYGTALIRAVPCKEIFCMHCTKYHTLGIKHKFDWLFGDKIVQDVQCMPGLASWVFQATDLIGFF
jgi:hypothetical protein